MLLKRLKWRPPRVNNVEPIQIYNNNINTNNRLHYLPYHGITSQIAKRINVEIDALRREKQFKHIVQQKRDWMSYLVLQILFKKNTTIVTLRSYERVLFGVGVDAIISRNFSCDSM